jgi:hypothetical protein
MTVSVVQNLEIISLLFGHFFFINIKKKESIIRIVMLCTLPFNSLLLLFFCFLGFLQNLTILSILFRLEYSRTMIQPESQYYNYNNGYKKVEPFILADANFRETSRCLILISLPRMWLQLKLFEGIWRVIA